MWDWAVSLDAKHVALMQLTGSTLLALASLIVAVVAVGFAYRNNFGWKPLAMIFGHGLKNDPAFEGYYVATCTVDFWNRRKYPVALHRMEISFGELKVEQFLKGFNAGDGWHLSFKGLHWNKREILEPSTHRSFEVSAPFKKRTLDDLDEPLKAEVFYFDPKRNKFVSEICKGRYTFRTGAREPSLWHRLKCSVFGSASSE